MKRLFSNMLNLQDVRIEQQKQLANIRIQSEAFIKDKITKADDANRLLKLAQEAKSLRIALEKCQIIYLNIYPSQKEIFLSLPIHKTRGL
ncbi:hypothetical protein [Candidatus Parabeggiatoa sp. HSG14]|uniref:hypothetical protein n=1 Tax=Candidatus Parabeggiatoa sp. HSG14 TaxID=3055593 RepID=UPI0025A8FD9B|nr:hypothetical protein [Thiotrichales bacterium HSG14]